MSEAVTMRRKDRQIAEQSGTYLILDDAAVVRLGLIDGDQPYVVPMNFGRDGDDLWLHAAGSGRKLECIRRHPRVCVETDRLIRIAIGESACGDWASHYESVIGFGTAEIVDDSAMKLHGLATIMCKYSGRGDWKFEEAQVKNTVVIRVHLDSLTGKRSPAGA